ncbi:MAG: hypothetical protein FWD68_01980 [Alphaproteobacteria bacterium]|nr:hypothetical protein [Alphaproteobacteria bacterium]
MDESGNVASQVLILLTVPVLLVAALAAYIWLRPKLSETRWRLVRALLLFVIVVTLLQLYLIWVWSLAGAWIWSFPAAFAIAFISFIGPEGETRWPRK